MARFRIGKGKVAVCLQHRVAVDDPLAVRAEQPDAVLPRIGKKLLLEPVTLCTHFTEAGRVDDDRLDPLLAAFDDRLRNHWGRNDDMGEVNLSGNFRQSAVGF